MIVFIDECVYFKLKLFDVKYFFWILLVGGKIDMNMDNDNIFFLIFDFKCSKEVGEYFFGKCVELCGFLYVLMDFKVKLLLLKEFK